jgi:Flp pilus assembly protein TadG
MELRDRRGSELVEFALIMPLLVFIVFGVVDFGLVMFDKAVITNAAREAARAGIVFAPTRPTETEIRSVAQAYCLTNLVTFGAPVSPTVTVNGAGGGTGGQLEVIISYPYTWAVIPGFTTLGSSVTLTSRSVMRIE